MAIRATLLLLLLATVSTANPYFRKQFETIVVKDQCLKACMNPVTAHGEELSLLKNADLGSYFGNHNQTCRVISTARDCIENCHIQSNPFKLQVMVAHCSNETKEKIDQLRSCFVQNGTQIHGSCASKCGNYKETNDAVHQLTQSMGPNINPEIAQQIFEKSNQACGIFKCMTRCNVEETKNVCGEQKANILQNLIQDIVNAQRSDLERLDIVEKMTKSNPPECDYMYNPEVVFNQVRPESLQNIDPPQSFLSVKNPRNPIVETQMAIFAKQMELLEKQERVLEKENHKLDLELALLQQKALQNEGRIIY